MGKESKKQVASLKYLYHFPKPTVTVSLNLETVWILLLSLSFPVKINVLDFCKEINFLSSELSYLSDKNLLVEIM